MRRVTQFAILLSLLLAAVGVRPIHAESAALGTPDNPVPLGQPILLVGGNAQEYVAIAEVDRGADAWQRIQRYSAQNGPAAPGKEYLMALVVVRYVSGAKERAGLHFQLLSNHGISSSAPNIVHVRPDFQIAFESDVMSGGWIVREVDPHDPNPLLAVTMGNGEGSNQAAVYFTATDKPLFPDHGTDPGQPPLATVY